MENRRREGKPEANNLVVPQVFIEVSDLKIVLLGKNVSGNSRVRNSILGIDVHESDASTGLQQHCLRISGTVKDRHITVINTLHLLNPNISDHQIIQTVRDCVNLSDPGPHVFILVLQYNDFTEEDMTRVKYVLNNFGEETIKRTIVITTDEVTQDLHMLTRTEMNTAIHQLIKECGGRHLQLERKPEWQSEIFRNVDEMLKGNQEHYLTCEMYEDVNSFKSEEENKQSFYHKDNGKLKQSKRSEGILMSAISSKKQKLNLVLCGSDGTLTVSVSKLLRRKPIKTSHQRVNSKECVKREEKIHGHQISLVELPALNQLSEEEVMHQTLHCVSLCDPGVHVFLLIVPDAPLNNEERAEIEKIQKNFYSREHFIVIFINDGTVNKQIPESQRLISLCGGQYCVMSLKEPENSRQIPELLDYIENMKTEPYSAQMYVKAQENRVRHETEEKYKEEWKRMKDEIKELKQKIHPEDSVSPCLSVSS
ncbi:GTPase IMAP family member 8-like [Megalobrama amblycephala]|uniref:GTPase IMAP family member 8-like n=1 Tax=Megalobrama amblycephala TaxID=75352 RepID=UPI0020145F79|nr:GTPase IMAP family member 8-like [Megalobrama amblycephala]